MAFLSPNDKIDKLSYMISDSQQIYRIRYKFLYACTLFFMMCSLYNMSFTWMFPRPIVCAASCLVSLFFFLVNSRYFALNKKEKIMVALLCMWHFFLVFASPNVLGAFIFQTIYAIVAVILISSPICMKKYMFNLISLFTTIILTISLAGWILYLLGYPLRSYFVTEFDDNYHVLENYYFFLVNVNSQFDIPRFCSMFLEPGQMASPVLLLLMSNLILNGRKFDIAIQSASIFFSFSLAGWVIGIIAFLAYFIIKHKSQKWLILGFFMAFVATCTIAINRLSEDSAITRLIIDRLVYNEETGIEGNNRTDTSFDSQFEKYISSEKALWGISEELRTKSDWTEGNSGFKLIIVHYGFIGFAILLALLLVICLSYKSTYGLIVFFSFFVLGGIRNFWGNLFWLYIILYALPVIKHETISTIHKVSGNTH